MVCFKNLPKASGAESQKTKVLCYKIQQGTCYESYVDHAEMFGFYNNRDVKLQEYFKQKSNMTKFAF